MSENTSFTVGENVYITQFRMTPRQAKVARLTKTQIILVDSEGAELPTRFRVADGKAIGSNHYGRRLVKASDPRALHDLAVAAKDVARSHVISAAERYRRNEDLEAPFAELEQAIAEAKAAYARLAELDAEVK